MTGSHADFERADDLEDDDEYGVDDFDSPEEEGGGDSDDDGGSLYQPTLIAKAKPAKSKAKAKKKPAKKAAAKAEKTPDRLQNPQAPTPAGVHSMAGSGAGNFDFNDSGRKANTLGSDQGVNFAQAKPG